MKRKMTVVVMVGLLLVLAVVGVASAASAQPLSLAIGYESALNAGDIDGMVALFASDAVYVDYIGGPEIIGHDAIREIVAQRHRATRSYDIVAASMSGDQLTLTVDIADRGIVWGRQMLEATVEDGLLVRLEPVYFRLIY